MSTNLLAVLILVTTASVVIAVLLVLRRERTSDRDSWVVLVSGIVLTGWATVTALLTRRGFFVVSLWQLFGGTWVRRPSAAFARSR